MKTKRKKEHWANVSMALSSGYCFYCKQPTYNVLHIGRYRFCADCIYKRMKP